MMKLVQKSVFFACLLSFIGCKDKKTIDDPVETKVPQVKIILDPVYDQLPLALDQTIFETDEGYRLKLREFKIYFTDLNNQGEQLADAALYNLSNSNTVLLKNGDFTKFGNLSFNIGVSEANNHADPSAFPNNHPLNIINANDMHWSWNPGYIFFKIEMIADTLNDGVDNFNHIVSYHVGQDTCLRTVSLTNLNWSKVSQYVDQLRLKVDFKKLLNNAGSTIDIKTESVTHSAPETMELSNKLATNFKNALSAWE
ncbi:MAG TPA: MbnP family protein [Taishania sp.]|nr:MbnP family protein [Taishania sp.]